MPIDTESSARYLEELRLAQVRKALPQLCRLRIRTLSFISSWFVGTKEGTAEGPTERRCRPLTNCVGAASNARACERVCYSHVFFEVLLCCTILRAAPRITAVVNEADGLNIRRLRRFNTAFHGVVKEFPCFILEGGQKNLGRSDVVRRATTLNGPTSSLSHRFLGFCISCLG